jgi:hypothetical protein
MKDRTRGRIVLSGNPSYKDPLITLRRLKKEVMKEKPKDAGRLALLHDSGCSDEVSEVKT